MSATRVTATSYSRESQLNAITALSSDMLTRAEAQDWQALEKMEAERAQLLENFFVNPPSPEETPMVAAGLRKMLDINVRLMALGEAARSDCAKELGGLSSGRRAAQAYNANC